MTRLTIESKYVLRTGYDIPILGFGTAGEASDGYLMQDTESLPATLQALATGYRHVDSARMYGTETAVGQAFAQSSLKREHMFVTSKSDQNGYESTKRAIEAALDESGLGYFDLYMPHSPYGGPEARKGTWRAMVEAKSAGKLRSLGVSNYGVHHLRETEAYIAELETQLGKGHGGEISVGQWELHPWLSRPDIVEWCRARDIVIEAYCPLVRAQRMDEPAVRSLAKEHGKSGGQVLLRWSLQKGFVPLPKSITPSRIKENADIYDFELTEEDMASLETEDYAPCTWDPAAEPLEK